MTEGIELLADPTRRQIVALIAGRVRLPTDIAAAIGLSRAAVSRQLSLRAAAGLVRSRSSIFDRRSRDYFIDPAHREPIIAWLAGVDLRGVRPIARPDGRHRFACIDFAARRSHWTSIASLDPDGTIPDLAGTADGSASFEASRFGLWRGGAPTRSTVREAIRLAARRLRDAYMTRSWLPGPGVSSPP